MRSSIYVETEGQYFLIDIGPDFRSQMLDNGLSKVDSILLTHEHNDHVAGIDDIRPINFYYKNDIPIFGLERVLDQLKTRFHYAFEENKYPGAPTLGLHPISPGALEIDGVNIRVINIIHGQLPILGFRFNGLAYLTDVKTIPEEEMENLEDLDILILSALRRKPHFSHLNLEEALDLIERIKPRRTYLTHISHLMGRHSDIEDELPSNVHLAYDGLELII